MMSFPKEREGVISLLKQQGINPTAQRISIGEVLLMKAQHLSAEQVLKRAHQVGANVSKATVYNTLNLFVEKGLLSEVIVDSGKIFFDSNTSGHYHFYNEKTGELRDFDQEQLTIAKMPELPDNTIGTGMNVIVKIESKDS